MTTLTTSLAALPNRCSHGWAPEQRPLHDCPEFAPADEWSIFTAALRQAAVNGVVHQDKVRPLIKGRVFHKHVGQFYARARREGLLTLLTEEQSKDHAGRNTHHKSPVYELRSAA